MKVLYRLFASLVPNTSGTDNTAAGFNSLYLNSQGNRNTALGLEALYSNTAGSNDIAIGAGAGYALTGSNDIAIGNSGVAGESNTVRIGTPGAHRKVYIAGIGGTAVTGSAVYITPDGQLGVLESSERYKAGISPMRLDTGRLQQLRPVTFYYRGDPQRIRQYGLIAEQVEQVFPELVVRDQAGRPQGVRYEELAPMLLREMQLQQRRIADQSAQLHELQRQLVQLQEPAPHRHRPPDGPGRLEVSGAYLQ
ncbi:MAG TPA: tail fiber domain-containing protein [Steroidobacteraceae bacterium]|nr:tail fiber domain-containing protein [Steroidobacteraceae bacterium]